MYAARDTVVKGLCLEIRAPLPVEGMQPLLSGARLTTWEGTRAICVVVSRRRYLKGCLIPIIIDKYSETLTRILDGQFESPSVAIG